MSDSSNTEQPAKKRSDARKRQARAMTRAIDRVSEEFIEAFSQTGLDDGPEKQKKAEPVRQALLDREEREKASESAKAAEPTFKGLGALLASSPKKPTGSFARLLESDENEAAGQKQSGQQGSVGSSDQTADGAVIKVRDTVGKKRGLYTSCMQRPDESQLKAWAKMAEIEKAEAEKIKAEKAGVQAAAEVQAAAQAEKQRAAETRSVLHKLASTSHVPPRQPLVTPPSPAAVQNQSDHHSNSAPKGQKTCAIRGGCAKLGNLWTKFSSWLKTRL